MLLVSDSCGKSWHSGQALALNGSSSWTGPYCHSGYPVNECTTLGSFAQSCPHGKAVLKNKPAPTWWCLPSLQIICPPKYQRTGGWRCSDLIYVKVLNLFVCFFFFFPYQIENSNLVESECLVIVIFIIGARLVPKVSIHLDRVSQ